MIAAEKVVAQNLTQLGQFFQYARGAAPRVGNREIDERQGTIQGGGGEIGFFFSVQDNARTTSLPIFPNCSRRVSVCHLAANSGVLKPGMGSISEDVI